MSFRSKWSIKLPCSGAGLEKLGSIDVNISSTVKLDLVIQTQAGPWKVPLGTSDNPINVCRSRSVSSLARPADIAARMRLMKRAHFWICLIYLREIEGVLVVVSRDFDQQIWKLHFASTPKACYLCDVQYLYFRDWAFHPLIKLPIIFGDLLCPSCLIHQTIWPSSSPLLPNLCNQP